MIDFENSSLPKKCPACGEESVAIVAQNDPAGVTVIADNSSCTLSRHDFDDPAIVVPKIVYIHSKSIK